VAIAKAVAGRFDHYICRRDDNLRDRAADEVPRIQADALRAAGVAPTAISVIPDEQEAIEAALRMGAPGDLLLIFADALARSWKQITKFKSNTNVNATASAAAAGSGPSSVSGSAPRPAPASTPQSASRPEPTAAADATMNFSLEGLIRDERGVRVAPVSED
jgi:cyanophycin synthetase